jgi:hypothetical protein
MRGLITYRLAVSALLCATALGQTNPGITLQVQNAGSPVGTYKRFVQFNWVAGLNCSASGSTVTLSGTGAGQEFNCAATAIYAT